MTLGEMMVEKMNSGQFSAWHYESDGDKGNKTHYAVRDDPTTPTGIDRIDFATEDKAKKFVADSNRLIFDLENRNVP